MTCLLKLLRHFCALDPADKPRDVAFCSRHSRALGSTDKLRDVAFCSRRSRVLGSADKLRDDAPFPRHSRVGGNPAHHHSQRHHKTSKVINLAKATLITCALVTATAQAELTIHINQGVDKPYPIAVLPMQAKPMHTKQLPQGFTQVIKQDLSHSGRFALSKGPYPQTPHSLTAFAAKQWQQSSDADYVILGQVTANQQHAGHYNVSVALMSLYAGRPLLAKKYQDVSAAKLRSLAHHISDQAYYAITGHRGIFSTHLAYVAVQHHHRGRPVFKLMIADADGFDQHVLLRQSNIPITSPKWGPAGNRLAYVSYDHNRMAIFIINVHTGKRHVLAYFPGMNSAPSWSPDGKKMAMALSRGDGSNTNIYIMDLASHKLTRLTSFGNNTSPSWAPDGSRIVFSSNRGGNPQIYTLDVAKHQVQRLTYDGVQNFAPAYTPDGNYIVYMHKQKAGGNINIEALNLRQQTYQTITAGKLDKAPSPAPNSQMIAYANFGHPNGKLAAASIDGKIQLTLPATQGSVHAPSWSPFTNKEK